MEECKQMGISVLGPDINESELSFTVNKKGEVRFGMSGMKGVGEKAVESIVEERTENGLYQSIYDFARRTNSRSVSKKVYENLVYDIVKLTRSLGIYCQLLINNNIYIINLILHLNNTMCNFGLIKHF